MTDMLLITMFGRRYDDKMEGRSEMGLRMDCTAENDRRQQDLPLDNIPGLHAAPPTQTGHGRQVGQQV